MRRGRVGGRGGRIDGGHVYQITRMRCQVKVAKDRRPDLSIHDNARWRGPLIMLTSAVLNRLAIADRVCIFTLPKAFRRLNGTGCATFCQHTLTEGVIYVHSNCAWPYLCCGMSLVCSRWLRHDPANHY